ncbi:Hypothetical_protein [Hexamita inflata]|uniref:Hypothetical_protein n=1 Tax=Hexamita inflata TaxID=28002 RepID=A0AA86NDZ3_9EUKA|nr:Hypothetical protein HINF_LOCUS5697 [Hexamita inflata]
MLNKMRTLALPPCISFQAVHPSKLTGRNVSSLPKLQSCLSIKPNKSSVGRLLDKQDAQFQFQPVQKHLDVLSQMLVDESEFDTENTNMAETFSKFNTTCATTDCLLFASMVRQNMDGLRFKNGRLDDMLILASKHQSAMESLCSKQMEVVSNLQRLAQ